MSTPYIGQLMLVPFNFAPKGYALCNGQMMAIQQNQALFSLFGTVYGGDGIRTFGLPNLQGQAAIGFGQSFGGQNYPIGTTGGSASVTLNTQEIPSHNHSLTVSSATGGNLPTVAGNTVGAFTGSPTPYSNSPDKVMVPSAISQTGSNQPHENRSPYLVLNWVVALVGVFPSRS